MKSIRVKGVVHPFHATSRGCGPILIHNDKPIWIVRYRYWTRGGVQHQEVNWQVYYPIAPIRLGQQPWAVDNRRIEPGFKTLQEALDGAEKFCLPEETKIVAPVARLNSAAFD